ncbi:hypothetical protein ACE6JH_04945 [Streptomyces nigra]
MKKDAAYVGCLARDLSEPGAEDYGSMIMFCMAPYLSLFVHESHRKLKVIDPALPALLSSDVELIIARSRNSLKLFEDNRRGIDGQLAYFRDEITLKHSQRFLNNTWLKLARFLETDLGIYSYDKKIISTTHAATFHLGFDPLISLEDRTGLTLQSVYEEYGAYFHHLGARLDSNSHTFVNYVESRLFDRYPNDVRAAKYYRRVFNGNVTPDINRLLMVFRGLMNFIDSVVTLGQASDRNEYTVFKIRFLTVYQVLRSLSMLHDERPGELTAQSMRFIERITSTSAARLITDPVSKPFRNTLMHYDLDSRIDMARVDTAKPLFGLVPIYFPSHDFESFADTVDACIEETTSLMEEWATS